MTLMHFVGEGHAERGALPCETLTQRYNTVWGRLRHSVKEEGFLLFIHGDGFAFTVVPQLLGAGGADNITRN